MILSSNVVKIKSACVSNVSPTSTISKLFFESPQIAHLSRGIKKDMLFVLDIMQVTFVPEPIVDLPTTGFSLPVVEVLTIVRNSLHHVIYMAAGHLLVIQRMTLSEVKHI